MTEQPPNPPAPPPASGGLTFSARVNTWGDVLTEEWTRYTRETPFWEGEILCKLTQDALEHVWHYLTHPTESGPPPGVHRAADVGPSLWSEWETPEHVPSWETPEVELQYAVPWDWDADQLISAVFREEELEEDPKAWAKIAAEAFLTHRNRSVLALLTRKACLVTDGVTYEPAIPQDLLARYPSLAGSSSPRPPQSYEELSDPALVPDTDPQAQTALENRYRPFRLSSDALVALSHQWRTEDGGEGEHFLLLDTALTRTDDAHFLHVEGTIHETPFSASLHVEFHPLVRETHSRRAFYPVVLSVDYVGTLPLTAWSDTDRRMLWDQFLGKLDRLRTESSRTLASLADETVTGRSPDTIPPPIRVGPPPVERRVFPLPVGVTKVDAAVLDLIGSVHKVRLPVSRWSSLGSWPELVNEEIARLQAEEGEQAFHQIPQGRGALLVRRTIRGGETVVRLTEEAENQLKIRKGLGAGFRYVDPRNGREYLSRLFEFRSGYLEIGLSWFGMAGPWVDEWRKGVQKEAEAHTTQASLFDELDEVAQARVRRARLLADSYRLMEAVLGQVGIQRQNPVVIPAEAFRVVLPGLTDDPNWKARLEGGLDALRACEFRFRAFDTSEHKGYGSFLGAWTYRPAGPGAHGDGAYLLWITPPFLGCLTIFESGKREIGGALVTTFDFTKAIPADTKAEWGWGYDRKARRPRKAVSWFVEFDAGRVFYSTVAGLTPTQEALHRFVDANITRRSSPVSRKLGTYATRKADKPPHQAADASRPRIYNAAVCPLLPEGRRYVAALGNRTRVPEGGWTLYGTARRESKSGGPHAPGLLTLMGYTLPLGSGSQARKRADVVKQALGDLKATIEEYLGGVVAARHAGHWLTLEEAAKLPDDDLGRRTHWFLFVPETYHADRREKFEKATGYTLTEDPEEARRAALKELGTAGLPLRERLRMARLDRGLSQAAVGKLFGVSQKAIALWEIGPVPDEDGTVRGRPIPSTRVPLLERWLMGGPPPTPEEIASQRAGEGGLIPPRS